MEKNDELAQWYRLNFFSGMAQNLFNPFSPMNKDKAQGYYAEMIRIVILAKIRETVEYLGMQ